MAAAPLPITYAADEQMRIEALRAAVTMQAALVAAGRLGGLSALELADQYLAWLLDENAQP